MCACAPACAPHPMFWVRPGARLPADVRSHSTGVARAVSIRLSPRLLEQPGEAPHGFGWDKPVSGTHVLQGEV